MKAIVQTKYGSPDSLELTEVPKPVPADDEVLARVHASSVNDWDIGLVVGQPPSPRPVFGWFKPRVQIAGCDVAGVVEATGKDEQRFKLGDAVYGDIHACGFGAYQNTSVRKQRPCFPSPLPCRSSRPPRFPTPRPWPGSVSTTRASSSRVRSS